MVAVSHMLEAEIPCLRRYARSLIRNSVAVDDLVQDTLLRALEKAHLWQPGTNLRAWMFTMMHNQYVNYVRLNVRQGNELINENAGLTTATQDASIEFRDLQRALRSLSAEKRDVVLMVCVEGMSYENVAEKLAIPIGTVRSRLSRARGQIRSFMADGPTKSKEDMSTIPLLIYSRMQRKNTGEIGRVLGPPGLKERASCVQAMVRHVE